MSSSDPSCLPEEEVSEKSSVPLTLTLPIRTKESSPDSHHLLFIAEANRYTYGFGHLASAWEAYVALCAITSSFTHIGVITHSHPDDFKPVFHGWLSTIPTADAAADTAAAKVHADKIFDNRHESDRSLHAYAKSALALAYEVLPAGPNPSLVVLIADAVPFVYPTSTNPTVGVDEDIEKERQLLSEPGSFGGFGETFLDWTTGATKLASGEKPCRIVSICGPSWSPCFYSYLSHVTGGLCFKFSREDRWTLGQLVVAVLMSWMGAEGDSVIWEAEELSMLTYTTASAEALLKFETEGAWASWEWANQNQCISDSVESGLVVEYMANRSPPIGSLADRYKEDKDYRKLIADRLPEMIAMDIIPWSQWAEWSLIDKLWDQICLDEDHSGRHTMVRTCETSAIRIFREDSAGECAWLAVSIDYTKEIKAMIAAIPDDLKYPCIYIDREKTVVHVDPSDPCSRQWQYSVGFLSNLLLECSAGDQAQIAQVVDNIAVAYSPGDIPPHLTKEERFDALPLALGPSLLFLVPHIFLPGVTLTPLPNFAANGLPLGPKRPFAAVLLAAIIVILGPGPLFRPALEELYGSEDWLRDEVSNMLYNTDCLSLLLAADRVCRETEGSPWLKDGDRKLFEALIIHEALSKEWDNEVEVRLVQPPQAQRRPIGPTVVCRLCEKVRSVTTMGRNGVCFLCYANNPSSVEEDKLCDPLDSDSEADADINAIWEECSKKFCNAQFVVLNKTETSIVKPKCYYCRGNSTAASKRQKNKAPCIECTTCHVKMIWPEEYRPKHQAELRCASCAAGLDFTELRTVPLRELRLANDAMWMPMASVELYGKTKKLHKFAAEWSDDLIPDTFPESPPTLRYNDMVVANAGEVLQKVKEKCSVHTRVPTFWRLLFEKSIF